jgi:hypothetical protein
VDATENIEENYAFAELDAASNRVVGHDTSDAASYIAVCEYDESSPPIVLLS